MKKFIALIVVIFLNFTSCSLKNYPEIISRIRNCDGCGEPLFLTPYITENLIEEGRKASAVPALAEDIISYSGFLTVDPNYNSNLFFWYFPARYEPKNAPVVVWLQGGPGSSSLFGLFTENGPYYIERNLTIKIRNYYWSQIFNVIYIDNPVGTGFSFTESDNGYCKDQVRIGENLYLAIYQFFKLFPELKKNEFFIAGESYGGKYVPALAYTIKQKNKNSERINLQGISIGNGFSDPINMMEYSQYLYELGLLDEIRKKEFKDIENQIINSIKIKDYLNAQKLFDNIFFGNNSLLYKRTGYKFIYNFLHNNDDSIYGDLGKLFESPKIRQSIHVGNYSFNDGSIVAEYLANDFMQSVKPWIEELLSDIRILFYNGQVDIIVPYTATNNFLNTLEWEGAKEFKNATKKQWRVYKNLAGYSKSTANLTQVLVRNAGHMVPTDQPLWAFDLISRFIKKKPLHL